MSESQRTLLGRIMLDDGAGYDAVSGLVTASSFSYPWSMVYTAIGELLEEDRKPDVMSIWAHLQAHHPQATDRLGSVTALSDAMFLGPAARQENLQHLARVVHRQSLQRELVRSSEVVAHEYENQGFLTEETEDRVIELASSLSNAREPLDKPTRSAALAMDEMLEEIHKVEQGYMTTTAWTTGIATALDDALGGLVPGRLVIVAARPKMGKSSFLLNMARGLLAQGAGVHFQSLEMTERSLLARMVAQEAGVNGLKLMTPKKELPMGEHEWRAVKEAYDLFKAKDSLLSLDYRADKSARDICRDSNTAAKRWPNGGALIVDYAQRMFVDPRMPRHLAVSQAVATLAEHARQTGQLVILAAQLRRFNNEDYSRKTKLPPRPRVHDLKETGGLEEHADQIILVDREEVHLAEQDQAPGEYEGHAWCRVGANRHGLTETVDLEFQHASTRFKQWLGGRPGA